jgi:ATP-dependent DNA ligase
MPIDAMGAKPAKENKIPQLMSDDRYVGQRKINGFRLIAEKTEGIVRLYGRGAGRNDGERTEYTDLLPHIVQALECSTELSFIIDGEVAFIEDDGYESYNKTSNVLGSDVARALRLQTERGGLTFIVFDCPQFRNNLMINSDLQFRYEMAEFIMKTIDSEYVILLPMVYGADAKKQLLDTELANGREGIVLKNLSSLYIPGKKRENTWYKIKAEKDADVIIVGYTEPDQFTQVMKNGRKLVDKNGPVMAVNRYFTNGWIGSLIVAQYIPTGTATAEQLRHTKYYDLQDVFKTFPDIESMELTYVGKVSSGISDELRAEISGDKGMYIGLPIEITYFPEGTLDAYYLPRFKRFRDIDKPLRDCIWEA